MIYKSAAISILLFLFSSQLFSQSTMITTPLALTYKIRQSNLTNGRPPLLILLHGIGSNEEDLFSFSNQLPANLLVVSVRAPYTIGNGSYSWFDVDRSSGTPVINPEQAEQSRLTLLKFISQAVDQFHADPQKVFFNGF
jgi:phospholipase/carboxylesterase